MKTLLIDGDVLVYQFAFSEEVVVQWNRDLFTQHAELEPAKAHINAFIAELEDLTDASGSSIILSDPDNNFRQRLPLVQYKQNRLGLKRPILWKPLRDWFRNELGAVIAHDIEGDDLLGLLATQPDMPPAHRLGS